MFFSSVTDSVMLNCTVENTRQGYFMATGNGNTMTGCLASGCENGVHLENEADVLIVSCTVEKCTVCGVRLDRTSLAMVHNTLQNNWTALIAYGNTRAEIADNLFAGNENCSMFLRNTGFCRVIGNRIENSGLYSAIAAGTVKNSIWTANTTDVIPDFSEVTDGFAGTEP